VSSPEATSPNAPPRLYRSSEGRVVAGVARGLAGHLGVDPLLVRLAFVVLAFASGAGVVAYALFWIFAPQDPFEDPRTASRERDLGVLLALGSLTAGVLLVISALGAGLSPGLAVPLVAVAVGAAIVWRQADEEGRQRWRAAGASRWAGFARVAGGIALVVAGAGSILVGPADVDGTVGALVAALVVVTGLALVTAPWWLRMARDLAAERNARIREQERAEVAAHVHDSVLHTLTLIQRHVDDPRTVARLARAQERDLRSWLYRPANDRGTTVESALAAAAGDVEDAHGVAVEVVVVGDCPLDDGLRAMLMSTREALVNAAKYAGDGPISLYAEVEPDQVTVFVRDRGPGFVLDDVPEDRLGLRQSVIGRMQRHGGTAVVRSSAGDGTEIELDMPRSAT